MFRHVSTKTMQNVRKKNRVEQHAGKGVCTQKSALTLDVSPQRPPGWSFGAHLSKQSELQSKTAIAYTAALARKEDITQSGRAGLDDDHSGLQISRLKGYESKEMMMEGEKFQQVTSIQKR